MDRNGDGDISRIEMIKALKDPDNEDLREMLQLPERIRQEDGTKDRFESMFQAIDKDESKKIRLDEWEQFFFAALEAERERERGRRPPPTRRQKQRAAMRGVDARGAPTLTRRRDARRRRRVDAGGPVDARRLVARGVARRRRERACNAAARARWEAAKAGGANGYAYASTTSNA